MRASVRWRTQFTEGPSSSLAERAAFDLSQGGWRSRQKQRAAVQSCAFAPPCRCRAPPRDDVPGGTGSTRRQPGQPGRVQRQQLPRFDERTHAVTNPLKYRGGAKEGPRRGRCAQRPEGRHRRRRGGNHGRAHGDLLWQEARAPAATRSGAVRRSLRRRHRPWRICAPAASKARRCWSLEVGPAADLQVGKLVPTIWSYLTKCLRASATSWFSVG